MSAAPVRIDPTTIREVASAQHISPLVGARFDPTGEVVVAGAQDNALVRWRPAAKAKDVLLGHKSWVRALAFQGRTLFSGDWVGRLLAWN